MPYKKGVFSVFLKLFSEKEKNPKLVYPGLRYVHKKCT